ncbi:FkbM family methyltransferase [Flavobacterium sp.]|uniref:FkbM family methyltransferase n=1 Tax=Flavobacterium sp. TaxID=239 RepID=UPI0037C16780
MSKFKQALEREVTKSLKNNFGKENYDEYRFGEYCVPRKQNKKPLIQRFKKLIKKIIGYHPEKEIYLKTVNESIKEHEEGLEKLWSNLNDIDRNLLVNLLAYNSLGFKKVKLKRNNSQYWNAIEKAKSLANLEDTYDPNFMHFILNKFDLSSIGYNIKFYFFEAGVAIDYIIEQYAYKINNKRIVEVESGDTVLDIGACWGDTALYFADKVGEKGSVYSFEFIPNNIKLFNINKSFNPSLSKRIHLVENPVSDTSGQNIYFKDYGPGSKVAFEPFEDQSGEANTISIDDFVQINNIKKIDFIKMDIEGAESFALNGAIETIKKFRPKLAIAIYHSMDDFVNIPNWIVNLDLDYEIFLGHYTIHSEETICFAKPKNNINN